MVKGSLITEEMRKAKGTWQLPSFPAEDVSRWAILRYCAATEDPNPLWYDEEYAKKTRWGDIIAPPTFVDNYSPQNRQWRQLSGDLWIDMFPFELPPLMFLGSMEFQIFKPVRPGDAISCKGVLGDIYEKQSRSGKQGLVFVQFDMDYYNQRSELVTGKNMSI